MPRDLTNKAVAEAIGTFALTFAGAGAICADAYSGGQLGILGVAATHGLILAAIVMALGHVSGAHVNPAVTLGAAMVRAVDPMTAAVYVGAQLIGAVVAGLLLTSIFASDVWSAVRLGTPTLGPGVTGGTGTFLEMVMSFLLIFVILQCSADTRAPRHVTGLAIGATLGACVLFGGPMTGAALNPARAFGPALASGEWSGQLVYWIGPAFGAVLAATAYGFLHARPRPPEAAPTPEPVAAPESAAAANNSPEGAQ